MQLLRRNEVGRRRSFEDVDHSHVVAGGYVSLRFLSRRLIVTLEIASDCLKMSLGFAGSRGGGCVGELMRSY